MTAYDTAVLERRAMACERKERVGGAKGVRKGSGARAAPFEVGFGGLGVCCLTLEHGDVGIDVDVDVDHVVCCGSRRRCERRVKRSWSGASSRLRL